MPSESISVAEQKSYDNEVYAYLISISLVNNVLLES